MANHRVGNSHTTSFSSAFRNVPTTYLDIRSGFRKSRVISFLLPAAPNALSLPPTDTNPLPSSPSAHQPSHVSSLALPPPPPRHLPPTHCAPLDRQRWPLVLRSQNVRPPLPGPAHPRRVSRGSTYPPGLRYSDQKKLASSFGATLHNSDINAAGGITIAAGALAGTICVSWGVEYSRGRDLD